MHVSPKLAVNGSAAGTAILPVQTFGNYLNENGIWLLSYAEWCKIVGTIWVLLLILEKIGILKLIKRLIAKVKK